MNGYLWMIRPFGFWRTIRYERERKRRQRLYGKFDPKIHGEGLLRGLGATDQQIVKAKEVGLA